VVFFTPRLPPYEISDWQSRPFEERMAMSCRTWALQGYGTPLAIHAGYLV